jgi:hypothetical protein
MRTLDAPDRTFVSLSRHRRRGLQHRAAFPAGDEPGVSLARQFIKGARYAQQERSFGTAGEFVRLPATLFGLLLEHHGTHSNCQYHPFPHLRGGTLIALSSIFPESLM